MTRATPLPPDERRRALIEATYPLLLEQGAQVSTRQIAEAAGVAEGTIFRVFHSKQELVDACVAHGMCPEGVVERLGRIDDAGLDEATQRIVQILQEHIRQTRALMPLLERADADGPGSRRPFHGAHRRHAHEALIAAVEDALRVHADAMSVTPRIAALALLTLSVGSAFASPEGSVPTPDTVARILLHGIAREDLC